MWFAFKQLYNNSAAVSDRSDTRNTYVPIENDSR